MPVRTSVRESRPALPCPECRARGAGGSARIGNYRSVCATCNNFSQTVRRVTMRRLQDLHREDYDRIRVRVEVDLYPQVIEEWSERL